MRNGKPVLVDGFCGGGGATKGYQRAGFYVIGVDIKPQPHYCGDEFIQADFMTFPLEGYDAVHASPPCQDHSTLNVGGIDHGTGWMLAATVKRLTERGGIWVVENVAGPTVKLNGAWWILCGSSFGIGVRRHRRFASSVPMLVPPCAHYLQPEPIDVTGTGGPASRESGGGGGIHRKPRNLAHAREVMGIDWMSRAELSQAIPPAFTEFIGAQLLAALESVA